MHGSMLLGMFDWIIDFFVELFNMIPKIIYLLYSSLACLLDVFQLALRKLAGLDVYYNANGKPIAGDIVTNFIAGILGIHFDGNESGFTYSTLSTVFWSFVVFGVIITFVSVFVAIIKSHYNYDEKAAKGPMQYVYAGLKAILNIAVVPVIVVLGLYVSQAVLTAVDTITSNPSSIIESLDAENKLVPTTTKRGTAGNSQNAGEQTYIYYDLWGYGSEVRYKRASHLDQDFSWDTDELALTAATNRTFFGSLFVSAAYNANRARRKEITIDSTTIFGLEEQVGLFSGARNNNDLADMIDTAFSCNVHLIPELARVEVQYDDDEAGDWTADVATNFFFTYSIPAFSKFNIGAVWYYYDLWSFNFIIGFGAAIVCVTVFINIIIGLITRIFMCLGLFLVAPPLFGLGPVDGGKASKGWTENFMKQVLMAYGAILGMNIFFLIFPLIQQIKFFNIAIADSFMTTLMVIVGLVSIKAFIGMVSGLVGGEDANKTGEGAKEEVGKTMGKAAKMTLGTVGVATLPFRAAGRAGAAGIARARQARAASKEKDLRWDQRAAEQANAKKNRLLDDAFADKTDGTLDEASFRANAAAAGMSAAETDAMWNSVKSGTTAEEVRSNYAKSGADAAYTRHAKEAQVAKRKADRQARIVANNKARVNRNLKAAKNNAIDIFRKPLTLAKDTFLDDKGLKGFTEGLWKPRDYARETAANTAAMVDQMGSMNAGMGQLNEGMGSLNQNVSAGNVSTRRAINRASANLGNRIDAGTAATQAGLSDLGTRVDAGTAATQDVGRRVSANTGAVTRARHAVEDVQRDTQAIKDNTNEARNQLAQINTDMAKAERDRADALNKQEEIRQEAEKIRKKVNKIEKNTRP